MAVEHMLDDTDGADSGSRKDIAREITRFADERCFRSVVDSALDAIIIVDTELRILLYNKAAELMFGYAADETIGQPLDMLIPPRYRSSYRDDIARPRVGDEIQPLTLRKSVLGMRAGGVEFPCEVAISAIDSSQEPMYTAIIRDVSGRKRAEEALRKSEALLFESQQIAHIGHWEWTAPGRDLICSSEVLHIFGLPPESLTIPQHLLIEIMHPDDRARVHDLDQEIMAGHTHIAYEYRIYLPEGDIRWIHLQASVTYTDNGQPLHMMGIIQDITERKQSEQVLRDRAALLEQVIALGKNVSAITNLGQCAREIHRSITHGLGFNRVGIFLYDTNTDVLRGLYGTDRIGQIIDIRSQTLSAAQATIWRAILKSPHELYVTDDFQAIYCPPADSDMFGVRQHVTLAAWAGEVPVAMIAVDNLLSQQPITAIDCEALQLFAGYVGLSLSNALLHAELERQVATQSAELRAANDALERAAQR